ncbi:MAG: TonB-dependent receptor [Acidobacteria bacterium]|nr:TonB-dependent receptor [Acidobacteriota bacterium]MCA1627910.1 TonB-dependent receptor [Acidobacteriota bacterium]
MSKIIKFSFAGLLVLALCAVALAQSTTTGAIGGVVTNPNKEVVPGASVSVKNLETNKEETATTDDTGRFKVANLQPGRYSVTVNSSGFSPMVSENVIVEIGRETPLEVSLSVGPVTGSVDVSAEAPVINTTQQDFSTNINQTSINELPINGRRWSNFALLTPGAVPDGNFGLISFRGISGLLNNNTIDGGDNNQAFFAEERGRTRISYSVSQAAIREFQVNTSSYSAEYGRSAGGVVNAITKSGTNDFHGGLFYYQRNNKWGARNPLSTIQQQINGVFTPVGFKPEDVRHQFGGTIGGPIVRDKAFFFFSYDQQKRNFPGLARFSSNTFLNLSTATRNSIIARGVTAAQIDSTLNFLSSLTGPVPRTGDQKLFLPKVDWVINDRNTFTISYNRLRWESPAGVQTQATNTRAVDNFGDDFVEIDAVNVKLASTLSPTLLNEFRMQWGRDKETQFSQAPIAGEPTNAPGGRSPQTFIQNGLSFGMPEFLERAAFPDERRWQFADTVTLTAGNHTLKFGGDINFVKDDINNLRFLGGEFNYTGNTGISDFIVDYVNFQSNGAIRALSNAPNGDLGLCVGSTRRAGKCYAGNFNQGFGLLGLSMKTTDFNYFIQDDWRVTPRFTLNLGLRYEYQRNPDPVAPNPLLPQTNNTVDDRNNFGPRIGFAYDLTGDAKTSVRGGWGLYYGRVINSTIYNTLVNTGVGIDQGQRQFTTSANNLPAACTQANPALNANNCPFLPIFPNLLPPSNPPVGAVQFFDADFQLPQIHQWDFIFEREIARNTVVSASYLGSFGNSLPNFVDTNLPAPARTVALNVVGGPFGGSTYLTPLFVGARPDTRFAQLTEIRSDVYSKYHALVLQANRRLTAGLQFQTNYTLSRASDNGQSSVTFTSNNLPLNAFDQQNEDGLSNFDRRHKFVVSAVYSPSPFADGFARHIFNGWTFAPILNAFSGARYTGNISGNINPQSFGFASNQTPGSGANGSGGASRFGLVPRNFFKQPKIWYVDARLSRRFNITEGTNLELLVEGFNVFNRTQVTLVQTTMYNLSGNTLTFNAPFASTTGADSTLFRERQVQFAARFEF